MAARGPGAAAELSGRQMRKQGVRSRVEIAGDDFGGGGGRPVFTFIRRQLFGFDPLMLHCLEFWALGWIKMLQPFTSHLEKKYLIPSHQGCV